jgi:hypothetical protein
LSLPQSPDILSNNIFDIFLILRTDRHYTTSFHKWKKPEQIKVCTTNEHYFVIFSTNFYLLRLISRRIPNRWDLLSKQIYGWFYSAPNADGTRQHYGSPTKTLSVEISESPLCYVAPTFRRTVAYTRFARHLE